MNQSAEFSIVRYALRVMILGTILGIALFAAYLGIAMFRAG